MQRRESIKHKIIGKNVFIFFISSGKSVTATQLSVTQVRITSWSCAKHVIAGHPGPSEQQ